MDIFLDPTLQFIIGSIIAVLAIAVACVIYLKQRQRKNLSYKIISSTPLLTKTEEVSGKLRIYYEDKQVQQIHVVLIRLLNSGNVLILANDYERQVSLSFGENAHVLGAEVIETNPNALRPSVSIVDEKKVVLSPILLNAKDSFTIKALTTNFDEITVDGRIAGVRDIKPFHEPVLRYFVLMVVGLLMVSGSLIIPVWTPADLWVKGSIGYIALMVIALIGGFIFSIGLSSLMSAKGEIEVTK